MKEQVIQSLELHKNIPNGFVQTEVGIIPKDWVVKSIGETITLINGYGFKPYQWKREGLPIVRIQNLNDDNASFNYYDGTVDAKFYIDNGDLVFAWSGSKGSSFGARIWRGNKAILNQHIFKVIPDNDFLNDDFCYLILRSVQEDIENKAHGFKSSFVHVKKGDLENTLLPIPPLNEQTSIANALSDVDALIQELEKLIAKKQAIKTATMQQLLTGRIRLPQFTHHPDGRKKGYKPSAIGNIPEDWDVRPLSDLSTYINDGTHHTPKYVQQGVPFYSVENVTANDFTNVKYISLEEHKKLIRRCLPERGDILMTRIGTLGVTRLIDWDVDASIYVSLALIKLKSVVDSKYVYIFSKSEIFFKEVEKRSLVNATPQKINMNEIGQVPIAFPTDKEEQSKISIILSDVLSEIQILENRLNKTRQIKQGMMQELLTGKTRLVKPAGSHADAN